MKNTATQEKEMQEVKGGSVVLTEKDQLIIND